MLSGSKESTDYPGYFEIPGFGRYVIDTDGVVLVKKDGRILSGSINPDGYCHYRIVPDGMRALTIGRHRLLAAVFKHPGKDVTGLVVNHINGIKGDDRLDNLEWATHQENIEHAGLMRLTEKCRPLAVRDVDSGEVKIYKSFREYSEDSGLSVDAISWRMRCGEHRIFPERKQYRPAYRNGEWHTPADVEQSIRSGRGINCQMRHLVTGEIQCFEKATDLAKVLGFSLSKTWQLLRDPTMPMVSPNLQIRLRTNAPWRQPLDPYLEIEDRYGIRPVVQWKERRIQIYESASFCAEFTGIRTTTLNYRLRSKGTVEYADGFRYAYYRDYIKTHGLIPQ